MWTGWGPKHDKKLCPPVQMSDAKSQALSELEPSLGLGLISKFEL